MRAPAVLVNSSIFTQAVQRKSKAVGSYEVALPVNGMENTCSRSSKA